MNKEKTVILLIVILAFVAGVAMYLSQTTGLVNNPLNPSTPSSNFVNGSIVGSIKSASLGTYLTDTRGMTLYVFADDRNLQSNCIGECAKNWPPYLYDGKDLKASTDTFSKRVNVVKRIDGTYQYSYGGQLVYYYIGDKTQGEVKGLLPVNNASSKWSILKAN